MCGSAKSKMMVQFHLYPFNKDYIYSLQLIFFFIMNLNIKSIQEIKR